MRASGLSDVEFGPRVDTFAGADGEKNARKFGTYGYPIKALRR